MAGCDDYLEKPYFIDDLKYKIRQYLPQYFLKKMLFSKLLVAKQISSRSHFEASETHSHA